jgi:hypothetical protein
MLDNDSTHGDNLQVSVTHGVQPITTGAHSEHW